jgi:hypothetical protein
MTSKSILALFVIGITFLRPVASQADPVVVRYVEGTVHGFLILRSPEGKTLASGDVSQTIRGDRVTSRLVFQFKDGSIHDETVVFSQRGHFRLVSDHLVQKGPAFERPVDMAIDAQSGQVTVRYRNEQGEQKTDVERLDLPLDLANGMIITLLKNVRPDALPIDVSFVAATPKPRLVKLTITAAGTESFSIAGSARRATHFVIKADLGGLTGLLAPLLGKQLQESHVWIHDGQAPVFVKSEAPLYFGGPVVRTEITSPVWGRR